MVFQSISVSNGCIFYIQIFCLACELSDKKTKVHVYMFDYLSSPSLYRPYYMNFCSCSGIIYFCRTNYQRKPTQPVFNAFFLLYSSVLTRMLDLANSDFYTLRFAP